MIDINKQYKTRDGREVKLFTTEGRNLAFPVIGERTDVDGDWHCETWALDGSFLPSENGHHLDLIEVAPAPRSWDAAVGRTTGLLYSWGSGDDLNVYERVTVTEVPEGWHLVPKSPSLRQPPSGIPAPPEGFEYWGVGPLKVVLGIFGPFDDVAYLDPSLGMSKWGVNSRGNYANAHYAIRIGSEIHKKNFSHGQA